MRVSDLRAMLITAGFGTRLAPLTDLLPKPAVPVANRPVAWFALDHLQRAGIRDFVLNTHHLADELVASLRAVAPPGVALRFVHEPEILGTGGGVRNAWQPRDGEVFVVMNGKLVFAPDIAGALAQHVASGALATMIVKEVPETDATGVVFVASDGRVRGLPGFAAAESGKLRRCMYTGVSLLSARAHRDLPENGCLIRDAYAHWLERAEPVQAFVDTGSFRDVGMSRAHYLEANLAFTSGQVAWQGIAAPSAAAVICDPTATVAHDARLRSCVVGARAEITAGIQLERCVVWPGTRVLGSHSDAILLPNGAIASALRQ